MRAEVCEMSEYEKEKQDVKVKMDGSRTFIFMGMK
jgi:hypothetical protein